MDGPSIKGIQTFCRNASYFFKVLLEADSGELPRYPLYSIVHTTTLALAIEYAMFYITMYLEAREEPECSAPSLGQIPLYCFLFFRGVDCSIVMLSR